MGAFQGKDRLSRQTKGDPSFFLGDLLTERSDALT
jgi:hypothetical protein